MFSKPADPNNPPADKLGQVSAPDHECAVPGGTVDSAPMLDLMPSEGGIVVEVVIVGNPARADGEGRILRGVLTYRQNQTYSLRPLPMTKPYYC